MAHWMMDGKPVLTVDTVEHVRALAERKANRTGKAVQIAWQGPDRLHPAGEVRPSGQKPLPSAVQVKLDAIQQIVEAEGVDWNTAVQRWSERQGDEQAR